MWNFTFSGLFQQFFKRNKFLQTFWDKFEETKILFIKLKKEH